MAPLYRKLVDSTNEVNKHFFQFNLTAIEKLQYTVYDSNVSKRSRYDWHQDAGFDKIHNNMIRKLSFVLLLSDTNEFTGGDFQMLRSPESESVPELKQGTIIFFPSPTMHRVTEVTNGVRKTIVGWVRGPHWV